MNESWGDSGSLSIMISPKKPAIGNAFDPTIHTRHSWRWCLEFRLQTWNCYSLSSSPSPSQNLPIPFAISHSDTVQWRNRRKPPLSFPNYFSFLNSLLVIILWFVWTEADMRERLSLNLQLFYHLIFFLCEYLLFGFFVILLFMFSLDSAAVCLTWVVVKMWNFNWGVAYLVNLGIFGNGFGILMGSMPINCPIWSDL